jgi:3-oxoacyl-[acyl-carrier protein] reductase
MALVDDRLDDQVALITGGSRGIGLAAAHGLASRAATVVLVGRDEDRARAAAADLMAQGLDAVGLGCNIADPGFVSALPCLLGLLARVDMLMCAAGVMSERTAKILRTGDTE